MFIKMKKIKSALILALFLTTIFSFAQQPPMKPKIKITGKVIEKVSKNSVAFQGYKTGQCEQTTSIIMGF